MRWSACILIWCLLAAGAGLARAGDPPSAMQRVAAKMIEVFDAEGAGAVLTAMPKDWRADPWGVALRLVAAGRSDVAVALAGASSHEDFKGLAARIGIWVKRPLSAEDLEALTTLERRIEAGDWKTMRSAGVKFSKNTPALVLGTEAYWRGLAFARRVFASEAAAEPVRDADLQEIYRLMSVALRHSKALGWQKHRADAYYLLGHAQARQLDFRGVLESWTAAAAVYERRGQIWMAATQYENLAVVAIRRSAYRRALKELATATKRLQTGMAKEPARSARWEQRLVDTLRLTAMAHERLGSYAQALASAERAHALADRLVKAAGVQRSERALSTARSQLAHVLAVRAQLHDRIGDYAAARRDGGRAVTLFEELNDDVGQAVAIGTLGLIDISERRFDEAGARFEQARAASLRANDVDGATRALYNQALAHMRAGRRDAAADGFQAALVSFRKLASVGGELEALFSLAELARLSGDLGKARVRLRDVLRSADEMQIAGTQIDVRLALARVETADGHPAAALEHCLRATEIMTRTVRHLGQEQGAMARAPRSEIFELGARAAAELEHHASQFSYFVETGRAGTLLESLGIREQLRTTALPADMQAREDAARLREVEARGRFEAARKLRDLPGMRKHSKEIAAAQAEIRALLEKLQRDLKTASAADLIYPEPADLDHIREGLETGDALVQFAMLGDTAYALLATRAFARVQKLGQRVEIEALAVRTGEALAQSSGAHAEAAAKLRAMVLDPLRIPAGVRRLLIVPDGDLYRVPVRVLAGVYEATHIPSGSLMRRFAGVSRERGRGVLALGDPAYEGGRAVGARQRGRTLTRLPGTRAEAKAIGTRVLLGEGATEAALRDALRAHGEARWRAIHFACHGLVDMDHPMESRLALTVGNREHSEDDGFLTAQEVLRLDMDADLAVLSACDSGRGRVYRGEGLIGLARAFMLAGAPRLLVSLWRVDDEATRALMTEFYRRWNPKEPARGVRASTALRLAQEHVRQQKKWAHPYYWAAWVLWGLPE